MQTNPTTRAREILSSVNMPLAGSTLGAGGTMSLFANMPGPCEQMGCQPELRAPGWGFQPKTAAFSSGKKAAPFAQRVGSSLATSVVV